MNIHPYHSKNWSLAHINITSLPLALSDLDLQGLFFFWHWNLWVKNDLHFRGHTTEFTPTDWAPIPFHGASPPARDYAALSGAKEEMFCETDVPVTSVRLPLLLLSMLPHWLVNYHRSVKSGPAPLTSSLVLGANKDLHTVQKGRSPCLICIGWMEIKWFIVRPKLVTCDDVNAFNTHACTLTFK